MACRQSGAALLAAMLTVTLVATLAAAALWRQFRSVEVEEAERARVQSSWVLIGALDWARLILREDARAGGADYLAEPWAIPLNEARLSSFLAADNTAGDDSSEAFLSGQISDMQARLNVTNLVEGKAVSEAALIRFGRLFDLLGLPAQQLSLLTNQLLQASSGAGPGSDGSPSLLKPLMPQRVEQLVWLGLEPGVLAALAPHITLLPVRTPVNLNTASAEVLYASTPGLELADAQRLVAARERSHFRALSDASQQTGRQTGLFNEAQHAVASQFFEVRGRLRLGRILVQEHSLLLRENLTVRTLWRDRGVVPELAVAGAAPS